MSTQFYFPPFNAALSWNKFDAIYDGSYLYATQDLPAGGRVAAPTLQVIYNVTSTKREDDVVTVYFTQTGNVADFQCGSIMKVNGLTNSSMNYTGMVLNGGSGWASYISPGWSEGLGASAGQVNTVNPSFTSGHLFAPTYTTKIDTENPAIITQLGEGYSQRAPRQINSFNQSFNLVYQNRGPREMRAITNYVQSKAGATATELMIPDPFINNQPNQKFVISNISVTPVAFHLYDIVETATRVFEP